MSPAEAQTANAREASLASRAAMRRLQLDAFAELLAEDFSIEAASAHLGFSASAGRVCLRDIRAGLGWQAV